MFSLESVVVVCIFLPDVSAHCSCRSQLCSKEGSTCQCVTDALQATRKLRECKGQAQKGSSSLARSARALGPLKWAP